MNIQHQHFQQQLLAALPAIRRYCLALTGQQHSADDLLQATVERALARWQQYQADTHFDRWLYRLCRNLWIDTMRREKPSDSLDEEHDTVLAGNNIAEQYETHTTLARVQAHMQQLSEVLRTTLYLVAVEGHSYQEAADIMEVPVGTIMSRLARARQQLSLAL